ncbi:Glutamate synthase [NADPH] small chain [Luteitalea pratensis]|uniref:Glutamate synthase [NADPH] small chain n=1 Tax=Luteitalea pratensis TaxID=1855912 RepID=A0A143PQ76_LUTPR|nr:NAD(P)-binding protein [Luteitalea pratensis]AMY10867.1 Glutamate synthase [NADPH] small chain [Luteitalea pratensis]
MVDRDRDLTHLPDLWHKPQHGPVRSRRPVYEDLLPPCNHACPAGEPIQGWLDHAQAGRYREAWSLLVQANPFPAIHGRVCYHPCESACNRGKLDAAVSIHSVERFLGDLALDQGWPLPAGAPASGLKVLVVGAGPSGLSAAYHLRRLGHDVVVRDAGPVAGGMMHFGIPAYRLPRAILDAEVGRLADLGVVFEFNHKVTDLETEWQDGGFAAVFLAVGAHLGKRAGIPARDAGRMLDALAFLKNVEAGTPPKLGRRVAVYGGGNTAMDAARTAVRLGYEPLIIYRRDREHMPAHGEEADDALEEGVKIHWLRSIAGMDGGALTVEVMALDERGRPHGTGEFETIEADALILALGQDTDTSFLKGVSGVTMTSDGSVIVDAAMMTGRRGLFAGGDMVPAERTVTYAVGHGRRAATHIDAWLRKQAYATTDTGPIATFDKLHLWFYTDVSHRPQPRVDADIRKTGFGEVVAGYTEQEAQREAARCLSCGTCFECDGCYAACPEDAILKLGPGKRYAYDYAKCTGCAVCFEQCPCHAISMVPEPEAQ